MMRVASKSAFTLFELIVSLAITSVIAVFVFSFAASLTGLWSRSQGMIGSELDANVALDTIAMDLEAAVFREGDGAMFAVVGQDYGDRTDSTRWVNGSARPQTLDFEPSTHRYGWAGTWLRFFTAAPTLNAVSYQIARREPYTDAGFERYVLHRSVLRQDLTMEAGLDTASALYYESDGDHDLIRKPWLSDYLLEGVIDFGIRLYVFDDTATATLDSSAGLRLIYPSTNFSTLDATDRLHEASYFEPASNNFSEVYPDVIEIYLRVLSDEGAELLMELEAGNGGSSYEEIVAEHARVFKRTVTVSASQL